jgi:thioredoxin reductase (NADPH)
MSCALWLHNYHFRPIIIESEHVLGGMARRSPYPNEWLLGRRGETARENAEAFAQHVRQACIDVWLGASPQLLRRAENGRFRLDVAFAEERTPQSLSVPAVVIATGTRFRGEEWLDGVKNARALCRQGRVHVGAPWAGEPDTDLGSHVALIGGGDNAFDVARMLGDKGVRAIIIMRSKQPRAQPVMLQRLRRHQSSGLVQVLAGRTVQTLETSSSKVRLHLDNSDTVEADHVLLLFGYCPNAAEPWLAGLGLKQDRQGYILVDANMEATCPGAFAIGDVANPAHPCIATAIAAGTMAAREIGRRLASWAPGAFPPVHD